MELGLPKFRIHTKRNRISEATRGRETEEMMKATEVTRFRIQVFEGQGRRARAYQVSEPRSKKEQNTPYTENE